MRPIFAAALCFVLLGCNIREHYAAVRPTIVTLFRAHSRSSSGHKLARQVVREPAVVKYGIADFALPNDAESRNLRVVVDLVVLVSGHPVFKRIEQSSGNPAIDVAAISAAERTSFTPGTVDGKPAAMQYRMEFDIDKHLI